MTAEEANKIIARYMGYKSIEVDNEHMKGYYLFSEKEQQFISHTYFVSLDRQIPVWLRLKELEVYITIRPNTIQVEFGPFSPKDDIWINVEDSVTEAACIATAKAIRELDE